MAAPAPAFALTPPDYDARLAPYAAVLAAAGFELDAPRPYGYPGVGGDWTSPEGWVYHATLSVAGERRPMLGSLMRLPSGEMKSKWLFECMQLDAPEELAWLLRQSVCFADAQKRAQYAARAGVPAKPPEPAHRLEGGKYLLGSELILEPLEPRYLTTGFRNPTLPH